MANSLIASFEVQLAAILLHQLFEAPQPDDLLQGHMYSLSAGLDSKHTYRFVRQLCIRSYRCQSSGQWSSFVYTDYRSHIYKCRKALPRRGADRFLQALGVSE